MVRAWMKVSSEAFRQTNNLFLFHFFAVFRLPAKNVSETRSKVQGSVSVFTKEHRGPLRIILTNDDIENFSMRRACCSVQIIIDGSSLVLRRPRWAKSLVHDNPYLCVWLQSSASNNNSNNINSGLIFVNKDGRVRAKRYLVTSTGLGMACKNATFTWNFKRKILEYQCDIAHCSAQKRGHPLCNKASC